MDSALLEDYQEDDTSPRTFGGRLFGLASGIGEALARTAASASMLLADGQLRQQGAKALSQGASRGLKGVTTGVSAGVQTLQAGPKHLRAALVRIQKRIEEERLAGLVKEEKSALVDVQVGCQVYEDAPQELRSRLWMALLEHPELSIQYVALNSGEIGGFSEADEREPVHGLAGTAEEQTLGPDTAATLVDQAHPSASASLNACDATHDPDGQFHAEQAWAAEDAGCQEDDHSTNSQPGSARQSLSPGDTPALLGGGETMPATAPASDTGAALDAETAPRASHDDESGEPPASHATPAETPTQSALLGSGVTVDLEGSGQGWGRGAANDDAPGTPHTEELAPSPDVIRSVSPPLRSGLDSMHVGGRELSHVEGEWEVVEDGGAAGAVAGAALLKTVAFSPPWSLDREAFRNSLMAAMMAQQFPIPVEHAADDRYSTLLQISLGQEEIDEVIGRDIHRTYPEYAHFCGEQGQQALFRVLKAYSLHDLEVGYCQGMGFVAGLILFYVPEHAAFEAFCRLLGEQGANLRRFYLPGLAGLKHELARFDTLMALHLPRLKRHLEVHGVVPVLFASQWFLTAFACPFPVAFACRVLDLLLLRNDSDALLAVALCVLAEAEADLLLRADFEDLLTYLKLEPLAWPAFRARRVLAAAAQGTDALVGRAQRGKEVFTVGNKSSQADFTTTRAREPGPTSQSPCEIDMPVTTAEDAPDHDTPHPPDDLRQDVRAPTRMHTRDDVDAEVARQQADMDEDFLGMVLELDSLWVADEVADAAHDAYDAALAEQP